MDRHKIFSSTLGLHDPWQISAIKFSRSEKRLDISIKFAPDDGFICPTCGKTVLSFDQLDETWHHSDFFQYATYLHALVPLVTCPCCGVFTAERPWSRDGSKFSLVSDRDSQATAPPGPDGG
jgi:transposase